MSDSSTMSPMKNVQISSNIPFAIYENGIQTISDKYGREYITDIRLREITPDVKEPFQANPRIQQLQQKIKLLKELDQLKQQSYLKQLQHIKNLETQIQTASLIDKERLLEELHQEKKQAKEPKNEANQIKELQIELNALRRADAIERKLHRSENETEPLTLSGTITKIKIE
jgi:hypothetical protein